MKTKSISPGRRLSGLRQMALSVGVGLAVVMLQPAANAQLLIYNPGLSAGQIAYSVQPVVAYNGASPVWVYDGFSSGLTSPSASLYDILASPGGTLFNSFVPSNYNLSGTGFVPLLGGFNWTQPAGGGFGGASMTATPGGTIFSIADAEIPGYASVSIAAMSADFTVGAGGIPGGTFFNTTLSFNGTLDAGAAVAASLVTYIADNTTHQVEANMEILAAGGTGGGNPYVAWSGTTTSFAVPVGSSAGALVLFGNSGTTFSGAVSASQLLTAAGINAGDDINILTVLTAIADPGATMDINTTSADPNNLTIVPEPGAWSLLCLGAAAWLILRKRPMAVA